MSPPLTEDELHCRVCGRRKERRDGEPLFYFRRRPTCLGQDCIRLLVTEAGRRGRRKQLDAALPPRIGESDGRVCSECGAPLIRRAADRMAGKQAETVSNFRRRHACIGACGRARKVRLSAEALDAARPIVPPKDGGGAGTAMPSWPTWADFSAYNRPDDAERTIFLKLPSPTLVKRDRWF